MPGDAATLTDGATSPDGFGEGPVSTLGLWMEGNIYRLKAEDVRRCHADAVAAGAPAAPMRLGVRVHITSKLESLLVAPRDLTLESEGVIFQAKVSDKPIPGCAPLLVPRELRWGKTASGIAVFELPAGFKFDVKGPTLAYQPTRWGGAKRTEVRLPACFPDCAKPEKPRGKRR